MNAPYFGGLLLAETGFFYSFNGMGGILKWQGASAYLVPKILSPASPRPGMI